MNITTVQPPMAEPVTLPDVYLQLKIDPTTEGSPPETSHPLDAILRGNIASARMQVEKETRRALIEQTLRLSARGFPGCPGAPRRLALYRPPVIRVLAVSYFDAANAAQTVDPAQWYLTDDEIPELRFVTGFAAPPTYDRPDAVRVLYDAGYAGEGSPPTSQAELAANVPQALRDAVLVGVELLQGDAGPQDREALERMRAALVEPFIVQLSP